MKRTSKSINPCWLVAIALAISDAALAAGFGGGGGGFAPSPPPPPPAPAPGGINQVPGVGGSPVPGIPAPVIPPSKSVSPSATPPPSTSSDGVAGLEIELCNRSSKEALVSIGYKKGGAWIAEGWWRVSPNQCKGPLLQSLSRPVYAVATTDTRGGGLSWIPGIESSRAKFCVDVRDPFTNPDSRCEGAHHEDYAWRVFGMLNVSVDSGKYTWTIRD